MLFCQLDYPQELGTGIGYSIAEYGCALTSVASILRNVFLKPTDPLKLNNDLNNVKGYASNGVEGVFDIIDWTAVKKIYPDIYLLFNKSYATLPADMGLINGVLESGRSVVVGVSFAHHTQDLAPTHYVEIYRRNPDGTYQMRDPMFRGSECDTVFDHRYAVNGMNVAQCILQAIAYDGPVASASVSPSVSPSSSGSPSVSPSPSEEIPVEVQVPTVDTPVEQIKAEIPVATPIPDVSELPTSEETIVELKDVIRRLEIQRNNAISKSKIIADKYEEDFKNYTGLVAAGYETVEKVEKKFGEVKDELLKHRKHLEAVLRSSADMAKVFEEKCKEDFSAISFGNAAIDKLDKLEKEFSVIAQAHGTKPTLPAILSAWDLLLTKYEMLRKQLNKVKVRQVEEVVVEIAETPVIKKTGLGMFINQLFGIREKGGENT